MTFANPGIFFKSWHFFAKLISNRARESVAKTGTENWPRIVTFWGGFGEFEAFWGNPEHFEPGTSQGPARDQPGTRQGPTRDQPGTRQEPGRNQAGTRQEPTRSQPEFKSEATNLRQSEFGTQKKCKIGPQKRGPKIEKKDVKKWVQKWPS